MNITTKPLLEDLNVIVSGQGGDGSLTVVNVLADVLRSSGMRVYTERDVLSRIKGGITAATLRASSTRQRKQKLTGLLSCVVSFKRSRPLTTRGRAPTRVTHR